MSDEITARDRAIGLSRALQSFHRALIQSELGDDPLLRNPYSQLFALISDPRFRWMSPLSALIARIDQHVADDEIETPGLIEGLTREASALLGEGDGAPDAAFRARHLTALQKDAEVGLATGRLRKVIGARPQDDHDRLP